MKLWKVLLFFAVVYVVVIAGIYVLLAKPMAELTTAIQPGIHKVFVWLTQP